MGTTAAVAGGALAAGAGGAMMAGGDPGGVETTRRSRYTKEQRELLSDLVGEVKPQVGEGVEAWPQDTVPPPTEAQEGAAEFGESYLGSVLRAQRKRGMGLLEEQEWQPERVEERWRQTVVEPGRRQWREETAPELMEQYAGRQALDSSAMARALAESRGDLATQQQAQLSEMMFQNWQDYQDRQLSRAQLGQDILGGALQQAGGASELSRRLRQIEAQQAQQEKAKWMYERPYENPWLQNYLGSILGTQPYTYTQHREQPGTMYQIGKGLFGGGTSVLGGIGGSMAGG